MAGPSERSWVLSLLGVATAATAMGIYNRAQIIALQNELFEVKDNVGQLFEVVQDYGKNMLAIETGFNELRTTLFYQVMFTPPYLTPGSPGWRTN